MSECGGCAGWGSKADQTSLQIRNSHDDRVGKIAFLSPRALHARPANLGEETCIGMRNLVQAICQRCSSFCHVLRPLAGEL